MESLEQLMSEINQLQKRYRKLQRIGLYLESSRTRYLELVGNNVDLDSGSLEHYIDRYDNVTECLEYDIYTLERQIVNEMKAKAKEIISLKRYTSTA